MVNITNEKFEMLGINSLCWWCYLNLTMTNVHFYSCSQGKKLMVIGTASELDFLESIGFCDTFSATYHIPTLNTKYAKKVNIFILYIVVLFASWVIACYWVLTFVVWMLPVTYFFMLFVLLITNQLFHLMMKFTWLYDLLTSNVQLICFLRLYAKLWLL